MKSPASPFAAHERPNSSGSRGRARKPAGIAHDETTDPLRQRTLERPKRLRQQRQRFAERQTSNCGSVT